MNTLPNAARNLLPMRLPPHTPPTSGHPSSHRLAFRRRALAPSLAFAATSLAACSTPPAPMEPVPSPRPAILDIALPQGPVQTAPGEPVILSVPALDAALAAALEQSRHLDVHVFRLQAATAGPEDPLPDPWLGDPGRWSAREVQPREAIGLPVVVFYTPVSNSTEESGIPGPLIAQPLPPHDTLPRPQTGEESPWTPVWPASAPRDLLREPRFANEARSPLTRWRYRLLVDGLDPRAPWDTPFEDPTVELISRRYEDRWRVALAWLWGADADAARRLRLRLGAVAEFPGGVWAPVWPVDVRDLESLLNDLLNPNLTPRGRAAVADRWLDEQPGAAAWVIDDACLLDPSSGSILPVVGLLNLLDRATLAWVESDAGARAAELTPLRSMQAIELPARPGESGRLTPNIGRWQGKLATLDRPVPVAPPGLTLGPLHADWSMAALTAQTSPVMPEAHWATGALVHRIPPGENPAAWEVFVECRFRPGEGDASREFVALHAGPAPARIARAFRDGRVEGEHVEVVQGQDRWWARFRLGSEAVEAGGVLRVGIVRIDAIGRRWCAPRAMLPWQTSPPRIAIDTRAWHRAR
jgi:hypothetical protein